jgi:hypothetical protein
MAADHGKGYFFLWCRNAEGCQPCEESSILMSGKGKETAGWKGSLASGDGRRWAISCTDYPARERQNTGEGTAFALVP